MVNYVAPYIWGTDLLLQEGDFVVSPTGDLSTIQYLENLKQAISDRLRTELGALPYDTNYGLNLDLLIGQKHTLEREEILKLAIIQCLKQEARIQTISQVQVVADANRQDILYVSIVVIPTEIQAPISLNLVYPYWTLTLVERVENETATSISNLLVDTAYDIYTVDGIWLSTDTNHTGTNFYSPLGTFTGKRIQCGSNMPSNFADVIINYTKKITP
jgi:phage baseplate assembly protein W